MGNGTQSQASPEGEEAGWLYCAVLSHMGQWDGKWDGGKWLSFFSLLQAKHFTTIVISGYRIAESSYKTIDCWDSAGGVRPLRANALPVPGSGLCGLPVAPVECSYGGPDEQLSKNSC
jgi:hypothetical protein